MCRINPRVDFAFKKLFGSEGNKDLLISLINAIVSKKDQVADIELKNPYNLADYQSGKISILDIKAVDHTGRWYNIEMQIGEDYNFDKRAIYYWAKLVTEQLKEGMMFKELKKTISINILDFNFIPLGQEYHSLYKITNTTTGKDDNLHDIFELHYIELRKFKKEYQDLIEPLDRWTTFLTKAHKIDKNAIPEELSQDQAIVKAINTVDKMFDEDDRAIYEVRMQNLADVGSKISSAMEKGLEKGLKKGMEKGLEKGMEKGLEQAKLITVENAIQQGLDNKTISNIADITIEEIESLRK